MAFAVRTNVAFNGTADGGDCPAPGHCVSFDVKNFLHIKEVSKDHQDFYTSEPIQKWLVEFHSYSINCKIFWNQCFVFIKKTDISYGELFVVM